MNTQINQSNQNITTKEEPDYRQLYEELQAKQQLTLSHISHEIRNPVTLINSFLQLLESHHPELKEDKYWGKIMENMDFLKTLLNEFSSFNNSGKLNLQELDLSELLENLVASSLPTLENYNVSLVLSIEPNLPIIQADKTKMSQLILNLLRNSSEAIKTKGVIHCSLTSQKIILFFLSKIMEAEFLFYIKKTFLNHSLPINRKALVLDFLSAKELQKPTMEVFLSNPFLKKALNLPFYCLYDSFYNLF